MLLEVGHLLVTDMRKPGRRTANAFTLVELPAVSRREGRAFTLIELLVVISIIALLVTILVPSLVRARAYTRLVVCQTHLRAQAQAHLLYAAAYEDRKPPIIWKVGSTCYWNWISPNTKINGEVVGQGILVKRGYLTFEALLCPSAAMAADTAIDLESWEQKSLAGSSYHYFWRHPSSVERDARDLSEQGATYEYAEKTGRAGLAMDVNAEETHPFTGAFGKRRIESHPVLGRANVSYIGGSVQSYDSEKLLLRAPGGLAQQLLWWDQAHDLFRPGLLPKR
ncbi:MAG: hypothetical protein AMK72_04675 [Planctomycetes bacterium SM23_25]|nr:MAG: hypothetical protein AMK72_04675 [Planctomycetes bacterium SM23_25]